MCVIVDADVASMVFRSPPDLEFAPVMAWIAHRDGALVHGGHLTTELKNAGVRMDLLMELQRAGRAFFYPDGKLEPYKRLLKDTGQVRSNDVHILALARASGARVLCTRDAELTADFKNHVLIFTPRGKVYRNHTHKPKLRHSSGCARGRSRRRKP